MLSGFVSGIGEGLLLGFFSFLAGSVEVTMGGQEAAGSDARSFCCDRMKTRSGERRNSRVIEGCFGSQDFLMRKTGIFGQKINFGKRGRMQRWALPFSLIVKIQEIAGQEVGGKNDACASSHSERMSAPSSSQS